MPIVSNSYWAIIRRHLTHWLVFSNRNFPILIHFLFSFYISWKWLQLEQVDVWQLLSFPFVLSKMPSTPICISLYMSPLPSITPRIFNLSAENAWLRMYIRFWSWWLNIGFVLFFPFFLDLNFLSVNKKREKKNVANIRPSWSNKLCQWRIYYLENYFALF